MSRSLDTTVLAVLALSFAAAVVLTALARPLAVRTGLLDVPDGSRKLHTRPTPVLGGLAVYLALLASIGTAAVLGLFAHVETAQRLAAALLVSAGLYCAIGLWDDKWPMRPRTKLLCQILASLPFVFWGRTIESIHLFGAGLELGPFGALFTIFWLVACTNIIILVDGLDGLAGTICLIVCLSVSVLAQWSALPDVALIAQLLSVCLLGFLLFNWPPAAIFLGDSGSLTLGFLIGALAIESNMKRGTGFALTVPLVLVSVPVFDTFMAILRRKLNGRGIGDADRGHIHHMLQQRGLKRGTTLLAISGMCLVMAAVTFVSVYFQNDALALGLCLALLFLLIVGRVFGYDETVLFFRYIEAMSHLLVDTSGVLRTRFFLARINQSHVPGSRHRWREVTERLERMGAYRLEYVLREAATDEVVSESTWRGDEPAAGDEPVWQFNYSVPRSDGRRATVMAFGRSRQRLQGQRLVDLFRLFDDFCQNWESDPVEHDFAVAGSVDPLAKAETNGPRIVPEPRFEPVIPPAPEIPRRRVA